MGKGGGGLRKPNALATVACPGDGCALLEQYQCPPHCSGFWDQCTHLRCWEWGRNKKNQKIHGTCLKHEPIEEHVNRTLNIVWSHLPAPTVHP